MTTACVICTRRQPHDGWTVCDTCLGHLDDNLARIVELTRLAAGWLAPRTTAGEGQRTVPGSRPPLDVAALDAALGNDALPMLEMWERMVREKHHLTAYGLATAANPATVAGCVTFLRAWLLRLVEDAEWPIEVMAQEVRDQQQALEVIDPDRDTTAGERLLCPGDHPDADGRPCHNRIRLIPGQPRDDIYCQRCGTTWNTNRLKLLCLHDEGQRIWRTPAEIVEIVNVSKRTIQRWADTGMVERNGTRYDLGQVWRLRMRVGA